MENSIEAKKIRCFLRHGTDEDLLGNINEFRKDPVPGYEVLIYVLTTDALQLPLLPEGVEVIEVDGFRTTAMLKKLAPLVNYWDKIIFYHETRPFKFSYRGLPRLTQAMDVFEMGIVYADYQVEKDGVVTPHPLIDYQDGSLRDDFDFGPLMMYSGDIFPDVIRNMKQHYSFAGLYDLRLRISRFQRILRLPEVIYTFSETDDRKSGEKIFDYVNPKNREVQVEMELACTEYLQWMWGNHAIFFHLIIGVNNPHLKNIHETALFLCWVVRLTFKNLPVSANPQVAGDDLYFFGN